MDLAGKFGNLIGGPIQAFTKAGVNPLSAVTQNKKDLNKAFSFYKDNPQQLNELGLRSNLLMRYFSGVGAEGLQFPEGMGNQLLTDIQEQEAAFRDPANRERLFNSPYTPDYIKQGLLKGNIPVYYSGLSDAPMREDYLLPTDKGKYYDRGALSESIGSFWAKPTKDGSYIIDEDYNFAYAPLDKGGLPEGQRYDTGWDMNPVNIGRRLVQKGYGNPYSYQLQINPSGQLKVR